MSDYSSKRFGGLMAILAGVFLFLGTASYLFWPREMIFSGNDFYRIVLNNMTLYRFTYILLALSAFVSLAVVMAVKDHYYPDERGALRWGSLLALIGFAVTGFNFVYIQAEVPFLAKNYAGQHVSYEGLGLIMDRDENGQVILAPIPHSPSASVGILSGDILLKIDGQAVEPGALIEPVLAALREKADGRFTLTILTPGYLERDVTIERGQVRLWDHAAQQALLVSGTPNLDPNYILGFGLPGIWLLILNTFALRNRTLPRLLAWAGIATGILYWFFVGGFLFNVSALNLLGQAGGMTVGPIWFIWTGLILRK